MDAVSLIGLILWIIVGIVVLALLVWRLLVAYLRASLRLLEATDCAARDVKHTDVALHNVPRPLRRLIAKVAPALRKLGFTELLTGARLTLAQGRADNYYHVLVSPDRTTVAELSHIRIGRVLWIWPVRLPFSRFHGPVQMSITLESFFSDHTTLITSTLQTWDDPLPSWEVLVLAPDLSPEEHWNRHKIEQEKLIEKGKQCVLFDSREAYFEKERRQREQIVRNDAMRMRELREEMEADVWDPKSEAHDD